MNIPYECFAFPSESKDRFCPTASSAIATDLIGDSAEPLPRAAGTKTIPTLVAGAPRSGGRRTTSGKGKPVTRTSIVPGNGRADTDAISMAQVLSAVVRRRIAG